MNRLVRADLKRILAKPGMYVVVVIMVVIILISETFDTPSQQIDYYRSFFNMIGLIFLLIPIYLSVYTDELKSGIMTSVIGMGMPRKKVVRSKLTDSFILLCLSYGILYIAVLVNNNVIDIAITTKQNIFLLIYCFYCVLRGIGIIALTSLVLFLTMSPSVGMLVLVLAGFVSAGVLQTIQEKTDLPVYDFSYMGLLDRSYAELQAGNLGLSILPALFYLLVVVTLNILTFDKKEMDL